MIDYHWDQSKNGFIISSAKFSTQTAIKDYSLIKDGISPGETKELTIFLKWIINTMLKLKLWF